MIRAGASGSCAKTDRPEDLADAVRVVARGRAVVLRDFLNRLVPRTDHHGLPPDVTDGELTVLKLAAAGASNEDIRRELIVAESTVPTHIAQLRPKLGAHSRRELVVKAWEAGIRPS
ncbi:MAG: response regulator transcription factor [Acidimicrobiales bacterium]